MKKKRKRNGGKKGNSHIHTDTNVHTMPPRHLSVSSFSVLAVNVARLLFLMFSLLLSSSLQTVLAPPPYDDCPGGVLTLVNEVWTNADFRFTTASCRVSIIDCTASRVMFTRAVSDLKLSILRLTLLEETRTGGSNGIYFSQPLTGSGTDIVINGVTRTYSVLSSAPPRPSYNVVKFESAVTAHTIYISRIVVTYSMTVAAGTEVIIEPISFSGSVTSSNLPGSSINVSSNTFHGGTNGLRVLTTGSVIKFLGVWFNAAITAFEKVVVSDNKFSSSLTFALDGDRTIEVHLIRFAEINGATTANSGSSSSNTSLEVNNNEFAGRLTCAGTELQCEFRGLHFARALADMARVEISRNSLTNADITVGGQGEFRGNGEFFSLILFLNSISGVAPLRAGSRFEISGNAIVNSIISSAWNKEMTVRLVWFVGGTFSIAAFNHIDASHNRIHGSNFVKTNTGGMQVLGIFIGGTISGIQGVFCTIRFSHNTFLLSLTVQESGSVVFYGLDFFAVDSRIFIDSFSEVDLSSNHLLSGSAISALSPSSGVQELVLIRFKREYRIAGGNALTRITVNNNSMNDVAFALADNPGAAADGGKTSLVAIRFSGAGDVLFINNSMTRLNVSGHHESVSALHLHAPVQAGSSAGARSITITGLDATGLFLKLTHAARGFFFVVFVEAPIALSGSSSSIVINNVRAGGSYFSYSGTEKNFRGAKLVVFSGTPMFWPSADSSLSVSDCWLDFSSAVAAGNSGLVTTSAGIDASVVYFAENVNNIDHIFITRCRLVCTATSSSSGGSVEVQLVGAAKSVDNVETLRITNCSLSGNYSSAMFVKVHAIFFGSAVTSMRLLEISDIVFDASAHSSAAASAAVPELEQVYFHSAIYDVDNVTISNIDCGLLVVAASAGVIAQCVRVKGGVRASSKPVSSVSIFVTRVKRRIQSSGMILLTASSPVSVVSFDDNVTVHVFSVSRVDVSLRVTCVASTSMSSSSVIRVVSAGWLVGSRSPGSFLNVSAISCSGSVHAVAGASPSSSSPPSSIIVIGSIMFDRGVDGFKAVRICGNHLSSMSLSAAESSSISINVRLVQFSAGSTLDGNFQPHRILDAAVIICNNVMDDITVALSDDDARSSRDRGSTGSSVVLVEFSSLVAISTLFIDNNSVADLTIRGPVREIIGVAFRERIHDVNEIRIVSLKLHGATVNMTGADVGLWTAVFFGTTVVFDYHPAVAGRLISVSSVHLAGRFFAYAANASRDGGARILDCRCPLSHYQVVSVIGSSINFSSAATGDGDGLMHTTLPKVNAVAIIAIFHTSMVVQRLSILNSSITGTYESTAADVDLRILSVASVSNPVAIIVSFCSIDAQISGGQAVAITILHSAQPISGLRGFMGVANNTIWSRATAVRGSVNAVFVLLLAGHLQGNTGALVDVQRNSLRGSLTSLNGHACSALLLQKAGAPPAPTSMFSNRSTNNDYLNYVVDYVGSEKTRNTESCIVEAQWMCGDTTPCVPGEHRTGTAPYRLCEKCRAGTYSERGVECSLCPANSSSLEVGATNNSTCGVCPVGTFSGAGASSCRPCPSATHGVAPAGSGCRLCPKGSNTLGKEGAVFCTRCEPWRVMTTAAAGSSQCVTRRSLRGPTISYSESLYPSVTDARTVSASDSIASPSLSVSVPQTRSLTHSRSAIVTSSPSDSDKLRQSASGSLSFPSPSQSDTHPSRSASPTLMPPPTFFVSKIIPAELKLATALMNLFSGSSYGLLNKRSLSIQQLADCGKAEAHWEAGAPELGPDSSLFMLNLKIGDKNDYYGQYRGALVSCVLVLLVWSAGMCALALIQLLLEKRRNPDSRATFKKQLRKLHFPGNLMVPACIYIPAALSASGALASVYSTLNLKADVVFIGSGFIFLFLVPLILISYVVYVVHRCGELPKPKEEEQEEDDDGFWTLCRASKKKVRFVLSYLFDARLEWENLGKDFEYVAPVYDNVSVPVYAAVATAVVFSLSIAEGVSSMCTTASPDSCCHHPMLAMMLLSSFDVAALALLRLPFLVRIEKVTVPLGIALDFIATTIVVYVFFAFRNESKGLTLAEQETVLVLEHILGGISSAGFGLSLLSTFLSILCELLPVVDELHDRCFFGRRDEDEEDDNNDTDLLDGGARQRRNLVVPVVRSSSATTRGSMTARGASPEQRSSRHTNKKKRRGEDKTNTSHDELLRTVFPSGRDAAADADAARDKKSEKSGGRPKHSDKNNYSHWISSGSSVSGPNRPHQHQQEKHPKQRLRDLTDKELESIEEARRRKAQEESKNQFDTMVAAMRAARQCELEQQQQKQQRQ